MAIILTNHAGDIITWSRRLWQTPGEYSNPLFHIVLCDLADDEEPVAVTDLGPATDRTFDTHEGPIICPRVHEAATVETEVIPQEVV